MKRHLVSLLTAYWALATLWGADEAGIEFFEREIRPILVSECYKCHSKEHKVKGGLRLDWKGGWEVRRRFWSSNLP